ncbi:MAG: hypothetical protein KDK36_12630, partial [Leptospiraceae bacterium]|nr:hypothetical protein [Leptospiraceae bacterium]
SELQVFIPKSAQNLSIQLTQGKKGMPIPLNLEDGDKGRVINRAILPGESNLQFSYLIESDEGKETIIEELPIIEQSESQVIFLKPDDMKLKSEGADYNKIEDNDVPEGMGVYSIKISRNKSYKIVISGGSVVEENHSAPRGPNVVNGTIFTTTEKSIFGVIAVLALLISLSFIFIYRKKQ